MIAARLLYIDLVERGLTLRVDDENDRFIVSPGHRLSDADRSAIRLHKAELMAMVSIDACEQENPVEAGQHGDSQLRRGVAVPSHCLGPRACVVVGICGRQACVTDAELDHLAAAIAIARRPNNPHVVPHFYPREQVGHAA